MTILILTPIPVENQAIRQHLPGIQDRLFEGTPYGIAEFAGKHNTFRIILAQCKPKPSVVAQATERAVQIFQPNAVIITGIAAKIKDAEPGDIVVGTKAYGYESGKSTKDGFQVRPEVYHYTESLINLAEMVARAHHWEKRDALIPVKVATYFGPIASGNAVINSTASPLYQRIKKHYNDTLALEMESIGFAQAMANFPLIPHANIRAISDTVDGKTKADLDGAQEVAARHAAAFVFELIDQLKITPIKLPEMDANILSEKLTKTVMAFISNQASEVEHAYLKVIIEKLEKIIPEAYDELTATPGVAEQGYFQVTLRNALKDNKLLQSEFIALLENRAKTEESIKGNVFNTKIINSRNVMNHSKISTKGDVHLGDTFNINTNKKGDKKT